MTPARFVSFPPERSAASFIGGLRANGFWEEAGAGHHFFEMPELLRDAGRGAFRKYTRRVYLAAGSFSNDPRGAPSLWVTGGWVNNDAKA